MKRKEAGREEDNDWEFLVTIRHDGSRRTTNIGLLFWCWYCGLPPPVQANEPLRSFSIALKDAVRLANTECVGLPGDGGGCCSRCQRGIPLSASSSWPAYSLVSALSTKTMVIALARTLVWEGRGKLLPSSQGDP